MISQPQEITAIVILLTGAATYVASSPAFAVIRVTSICLLLRALQAAARRQRPSLIDDASQNLQWTCNVVNTATTIYRNRLPDPCENFYFKSLSSV